MIRTLALAVLMLAAVHAQAATILGNLDNTTPGDTLLFGSTTTINSTQAKAAVFAVGQQLVVDDVFLALSNFDENDVFEIVIATLSSGNVTGTRVLELIAPTRSQDNEARVWQFAAAGTEDIVLDTGVDYALALTGDVGSFTWGRVGSSPITPTGLATFDGYYFSSDGGATFARSADQNLTNSFTITGHAVPAPAPVLLLPASLLVLARLRHPRAALTLVSVREKWRRCAVSCEFRG